MNTVSARSGNHACSVAPNQFATAPNDKESRRDDLLNRVRLASTLRTIRGILECHLWTTDAADVDLMRSGIKIYRTTDHGRGCNCPDHARVRILRDKMANLLCGSPIGCKHGTIRTLRAGAVVQVFDPLCPGVVIARAELKAGQKKPSVTIYNRDRWEQLGAMAYDHQEAKEAAAGRVGSVVVNEATRKADFCD